MASITTLSTTGSATFTASGLASGMDTNSIIDQLVALEKQPITLLQNQQSAMKTQVSTLGSLVSKLAALGTAASDLGTNGVFATTVTSSNTAFTATAGTAAVPGRYTVEVTQLARAAKWRSDAFTSTDTLAAGTLRLTVQGKPYPPLDQAALSIAPGASLGDVAAAIRQSGAPVSAVVLSDGSGNSYLSITDRDTGAPLDGSTPLSLDYQRADGATGTDLTHGAPSTSAAQNAEVWVDGLRFVRSSNTVSDVLPGTTLSLTKEAPGAAEDVVIGTDADGTQKRLQTFVDAYNGVMSLVQKQLGVNKDSDRTTSLVGVSSVRSLQDQLHQLLVTKVPGLANVRTLADLGLKSSKDDGSLSIDATRLQTVLSSDPAAVNALFSTAGTGLAKLVQGMVDRNTLAGSGSLVMSQDSLNQRVKDLDDQITMMNARVDAYRANLVARFTAMETVISSLKTMGNALTSWSNANSNSKSS